MPILQNAPDEQLARLLDLFPVAHLRSTWPAIKEKKKQVICERIAAQRDIAKIATFIEGHFSCTRQHVYIWDRTPGAVAFPDDILDGEKIRSTAHSAIYIARFVRGIVIQNPFGHTTITFLWPIRIDSTTDHLIIRFVVLVKDLAAYFDGPVYPAEKGIEETDILESISSGIPTRQFTPCDLHKGVKALWHPDVAFMDAFRTGYKTKKFSGTVKMHEEKGIRENEPAMFQTLMKSPLSEMTFRVAPNQEIKSVDGLSIDPGKGTLSFHRYAETTGDTDRVIRKILQHN